MIYPIIHATHIEKAEKPFYVNFYRPKYFNEYWHEAKYKTYKVLAETEDGALKIAKYHWGWGKEFKLVSVDDDELAK